MWEIKSLYVVFEDGRVPALARVLFAGENVDTAKIALQKARQTAEFNWPHLEQWVCAVHFENGNAIDVVPIARDPAADPYRNCVTPVFEIAPSN